MAKPNYAFQKRQRELAKKQKKEAKKAQKAAAAAEPTGSEDQRPEGEGEDSGTPETRDPAGGPPE